MLQSQIMMAHTRKFDTMREHIELEKAIVEKIDQDVLVTRYRSNTDITVQDAQEIDNAHLTMAQGGDVFIIADLSIGSTRIAKSAQDYFIRKGRMIPYTKGIAIVSHQKSTFFTRLFKGMSRTLYPTKEFSTFDEASAWINTLRN